MGISPFLTQNIFFNPFYTFCTWGNFKKLANAEHLQSTHPTVQCTQDISEVHTDTIWYCSILPTGARCRFPYTFRLSKAKDRLSKDDGGRCQFFIHKYSLVELNRLFQKDRGMNSILLLWCEGCIVFLWNGHLREVTSNSGYNFVVKPVLFVVSVLLVEKLSKLSCSAITYFLFFSCSATPNSFFGIGQTSIRRTSCSVTALVEVREVRCNFLLLWSSHFLV